MPGGVVHQPGGDKHLGPVRRQQALQRHRIDPVVPARRMDHPRMVLAQVGAEVEVADVIQQHGVAGRQQHAQQGIDGVHGAAGQHDVLHRHPQPRPRQLHLEGVAQRQIAQRVAILHKAQARRADGLAQRLAEQLGIQPLLREEATTGPPAGMGGKGALQACVQIGFRRDRAEGRAAGWRGDPTVDKVTAPLDGGDGAAGAQAIERIDHRVFADGQLLTKLPQ